MSTIAHYGAALAAYGMGGEPGPPGPPGPPGGDAGVAFDTTLAAAAAPVELVALVLPAGDHVGVVRVVAMRCAHQIDIDHEVDELVPHLERAWHTYVQRNGVVSLVTRTDDPATWSSYGFDVDAFDPPVMAGPGGNVVIPIPTLRRELAFSARAQGGGNVIAVSPSAASPDATRWQGSASLLTTAPP